MCAYLRAIWSDPTAVWRPIFGAVFHSVLMPSQLPGELSPKTVYAAFEGWRTLVTTENVAILFTDIVGSTELSQRLWPEAGDELRREHFSILRQAIAEAGGTEVKNLGDGLMVVFASASAALACGVSMQQAV